MTRFKTAAALLAVAAAMGVSACATPYGPTNYGTYEQGRMVQTETGTIVGARPVTFTPNDLQGGTAAGALLGGAAGVALGGDTEGAILGGVAGAVAGGLAGREIQRGVQTTQGVAYTVELDNRQIVTVSQGGQPIPVGTRVFVEMGPQARVYPQTGGAAYGAAPGGYAPPPQYGQPYGQPQYGQPYGQPAPQYGQQPAPVYNPPPPGQPYLSY